MDIELSRTLRAPAVLVSFAPLDRRRRQSRVSKGPQITPMISLLISVCCLLFARRLCALPPDRYSLVPELLFP